uniref:Uncharacterized protein n=1 Tax=Physcomitrium patens TaxID=3218 RepID=A0A2K1J0G3_PHYPA|nr:hypothetical protein PHYPA_022912 [Physcomitrium patens]
MLEVPTFQSKWSGPFLSLKGDVMTSISSGAVAWRAVQTLREGCGKHVLLYRHSSLTVCTALCVAPSN